MTINEHEASGRFIPLTQIKTSEELTRFLTDMVPLLHLPLQHAESIRYIVSELVRNVLEHANAVNGAIVCAQYHASGNKIRLGIVDTGVGIKKTINYSYSANDDIDAIRLALKPGITGTTRKEGGTEFNAGAGLFFIKSIAFVNQNFFAIYSGSGLYKLLKRTSSKPLSLNADPFLDRHSKSNSFPYWQGTVVGVDISLDTNHAFTTLLDLIRDTYSEAVKERKKMRYKKPTFT
jgi:anti-sigma regulatory factor (Ser/Thr protein kinase)